MKKTSENDERMFNAIIYKKKDITSKIRNKNQTKIKERKNKDTKIKRKTKNKAKITK